LAEQTILTASDQARKVWLDWYNFEAETDHKFQEKWMGGEGSAIKKDTTLKNEPGDQVKHDLVAKLTGEAIINFAAGEPSRLSGSEATISRYQDNVTIGSFAKAMMFKKLSQQRTVHDLMRESEQALARFMGDSKEDLIVKKLSGITYTGSTYDGTTTTTGVTFGEAATACTNILRPNNIGNDDALTDSDVMTLSLLKKSHVYAISGGLTAGMYKMKKPNGGLFICVISPEDRYNLDNDPEFEQAASFSAVRGPENPLWSWGDVIHQDKLIATHDSLYSVAEDGTTVGRALFLGQHAGLLSYVADIDFSSSEKGGFRGDYFMRNLGFEQMLGFDKATYNSLDWSVIAIHVSQSVQ